jgi:hypothetical protein
MHMCVKTVRLLNISLLKTFAATETSSCTCVWQYVAYSMRIWMCLPEIWRDEKKSGESDSLVLNTKNAYIRVCVCVYVYITCNYVLNIYIHTHTHIHTYIHTHTLYIYIYHDYFLWMCMVSCVCTKTSTYDTMICSQCTYPNKLYGPQMHQNKYASSHNRVSMILTETKSRVVVFVEMTALSFAMIRVPNELESATVLCGLAPAIGPYIDTCMYVYQCVCMCTCTQTDRKLRTSVSSQIFTSWFNLHKWMCHKTPA